MYLLVIFLPLIGFFINALFGRFFGRNISVYMALYCSFTVFILSIFIFYEIVLLNSLVSITLYN
jgi:NADH:ubiquinone oxidoreductase subunit 5 (subunit L)/multisubunit Na+/H+ antiporter MnhA subunit